MCHELQAARGRAAKSLCQHGGAFGLGVAAHQVWRKTSCSTITRTVACQRLKQFERALPHVGGRWPSRTTSVGRLFLGTTGESASTMAVTLINKCGASAIFQRCNRLPLIVAVAMRKSLSRRWSSRWPRSVCTLPLVSRVPDYSTRN